MEKPIDRFVKILLILSGEMFYHNIENFERYITVPETLVLNFSERELDEVRRQIPVK